MNIAFFYPSRNIGGAQLLIARLALALDAIDKEVVIIDYSDGYVCQFLKEKNVKFQHVIYNDAIVELDQSVILITYLLSYPTLKNKVVLTDDSKVFFWSVHPYNILVHFYFMRFYIRIPTKVVKVLMIILELRRYRKTRDDLKVLNQSGSLLYMDYPNYKMSYDLDLFTDPAVYLPISVPFKSAAELESKRLQKSKLKIAWVGRYGYEKQSILIHLIKDLNRIISDYSFELHIIGSGDFEELKSNAEFTLINHEVLSSEELSTFLDSKVDCLFAMGTSALEGAVLGIPTILLDFTRSKVPSWYKYQWLFSAKDYSLGEIITRETRHTLSILNVFEILNDQELNTEIGIKCKKYVIENHSIDVVTDRLIDLTNKQGITYVDYKELSIF